MVTKDSYPVVTLPSEKAPDLSGIGWVIDGR